MKGGLKGKACRKEATFEDTSVRIRLCLHHDSCLHVFCAYVSVCWCMRVYV